ncbi:aldo/keto reductase [Lelliottia amnigena]|nr:aldo/keto reductase [Lelliottia amnigena]
MVQRIALAPQGPEFSRFVMGYWRLMDWNMSPRQLVSFIEEHLDLGITTVDHADIYGGYLCEAAFGEAMKLAPALRERMEIVTKCGIATTANPDNALGHYITDSDHIIKSAEQSLVNLATDRLDLLLIHRPDPLMDADEVAAAFLNLHQSGKVRHFGVSNFTLRNSHCFSLVCRLRSRPTRLKSPRYTSHCCLMARSISCNSCVFGLWRGLVSAVAVCSMTTLSSRYVMSSRPLPVNSTPKASSKSCTPG